MISATASSTTLRVLENGALNTATPRRDAVSRSIWLVPIQKAPTAVSPCAFSRTPAVTWVLDRMPSTSTSASASTSSASSIARAAVVTTSPAWVRISSAIGCTFSSISARGAATWFILRSVGMGVCDGVPA